MSEIYKKIKGLGVDFVLSPVTQKELKFKDKGVDYRFLDSLQIKI